MKKDRMLLDMVKERSESGWVSVDFEQMDAIIKKAKTTINMRTL